MSISKFFIIFGLQLAAFAILKLFFFTAFNFHSTIWVVVYLAATAILSVALVRRLGVITFLEAIFIAVFWFLMDLVVDSLITAPLVKEPVFSTWALWLGYLVMMIFVFLFHKKRHVHIRKEQAAHHHGHH